MISRRSVLIAVPATTIAANCFAAIQPTRYPYILDSLRSNLYASNQAVSIFRAEFLNRMEGKYVTGYKNKLTERIFLQARYSYEPSTDYLDSSDLEFVQREIAVIMNNEIVSEIDQIRNKAKLELVRLDAELRIDPYTFMPYLRFYIDTNV